MTFAELLAAHSITMAELNRRYGIPKRTMEDWKAEKRTPPEYVINLLKYALSTQN